MTCPRQQPPSHRTSGDAPFEACEGVRGVEPEPDSLLQMGRCLMCSGFVVQGSVFGVRCSVFSVQGSGFRVQGSVA